MNVHDDYFAQTLDDIKTRLEHLQNVVLQLKVEVGKVQTRLDFGNGMFDNNNKRLADLDKRLFNVEKRMAAIYAIAAFLGTLSGLAVNLLSLILHR